MSYDFRLFRRKAGEEPIETAHADSGDFPATPPDPKKEALKRKVADALIAHNPKLEISKFGYEAIARLQKISVQEARLKYRHLELNELGDDCDGVQITLFDDEAAVTVPYWHEGDKATETFREIWGYLEMISRETGYLIYDPQIDKVIEPSEGFDAALACYGDFMRKMR